jgi:hypothetical protein
MNIKLIIEKSLKKKKKYGNKVFELYIQFIDVRNFKTWGYSNRK